MIILSANRRGVTLIEVLVVVGILLILAGIALPNFQHAQVRAKVTRVLADLQMIRTGIEAYAVDQKSYPRMTYSKAPFRDVYQSGDDNAVPLNFTLPPSVSSPVAYLSSSTMKDPFALGRSRSWPYPHLYRYEELRSGTVIEETGDLVLTMAPRTFDREFGAYMLLSMGPLPEYNGYNHYTQYDPTNGTLSDGRIIVSQRHSDRVAYAEAR